MRISIISVKRYTEGTLDRVYLYEDQEAYDLISQFLFRVDQNLDGMCVALESLP